MTVINSFTGSYEFLSNFAHSPLNVGIEYPTAEHAFQARKTYEPEWGHKIASASTPGEAKRLGRQAPMHPNWEAIKIGAMRKVVEAKFFQNPELGQKLLDTGNALLVEGNTWHDQFWGNCTCPEHAGTDGANVLGLILMMVRADLRARETDR
jgi:ribA/ribD-fused uncharacterized protein